MEVIRARVYGYCMGVRRAMEKALAEASRAGGRVYSLGPLIHNRSALASLEALGLRVLDETNLPDNLSGSTVIIRAHGVSPSVMRALGEKGATAVDATCPRVTSSQKKAARAVSEGYDLFLAGERSHGEVVGIAGWAPGCRIVGTPEEARDAALALKLERPDSRPLLLGQTTITEDEYSAIAGAIRSVFPALVVVDSICPATMDRQDAMAELCGKVDAVVVVGGRHSANTSRLFRAALERGLCAWHVETADELPAEVFRCSRVGLSAGASTPDEVIDLVEKRLLSGT